MKLLAIDSSNKVMGVAVSENGKVLGEFLTNLKKNHSTRLMPAIEMLMNEVNMHPDQLEKIVVAYGPGSYTGVRIGVSIAKAMAWSLAIPLVGVSSLEVLAQNGRYFSGWIVPLFDARRGRVYTGLYEGGRGEVRRVKQDRIMPLADWLKEIGKSNQDVLFIGADVALHQETIRRTLGERAMLAPGACENPQPGALALLGEQRQPEKDVHAFVPNYLQLAEAETKWLARQNGETMP